MATNLTRYELLNQNRQKRYERKQQSALDNYLQAQQQTAQEQKAQEAEDDDNWLVSALATVGDLSLAPLYGLADTTEGATDFLLGLVGAAGGLFDDDFTDTMKDIISYNATYEWLEKPHEGIKEASYLDTNENFLRDVSRGVGAMLPSIVVSYFGSPVAGALITGGAAAGSGMQEAYQDGAEFYEGLGYGLSQGAVEFGTEALFSGVTSKIFGKGILGAGKTVGKEVAETGTKRVIKGLAEEAAEEAIAEAVNPLTKTIYKGSEALEEYKDPEFYKGVAKSAAMGAAVAGVVGGMTGDMTKSRDVSESLQSIGNLKKMQNDYFVKDLLTDDLQGKIKESTAANLNNIETTLKKSSETKRQDLIKKFGLENLFQEDGTVREGAAERLVGDTIPTGGTNASESVLAGADRRYMSPSLWSQRETVAKDLAQITNDLRTKKDDFTIPDIEVYNGELSDTESTAYKQAKKAVAALSDRTTTGLNLVLVNENNAFSGVIPWGSNTVYITKDALTKGTWAKTLVHETMHFAEGTAEYFRLVSLFTSDADLYNKTVANLISEGNPYGFDAQIFESLKAKLESGEQLTEAEQELMNELGASLGEAMLGNEQFIERIAQKDASLARRILAKIRDLIDAFRTLGNKEARAQYKRLKAAEQLYMKAIENAGAKTVAELMSDLASEIDAEADIPKIALGMSDEKRYEALKDRAISLSAVTDNRKLEDAKAKLNFSERDLEFSKYTDKVKLFKKIGEEFSIFHDYENQDINVVFSFSKGKMQESVNKQKKNFQAMAKMLTCFDNVIENAVGIEIHNRNQEGYKPDESLNKVYVLASAFVDGKDIIPVKLEVKEFFDKKSTLHVAIALESIEIDGIVKQETTQKKVARQYSPPSDISIAEYFQKINPSDKSFYKYIPEPFLTNRSQFSLSPSERNFNFTTEDEDLQSRIKAKTRNLNPPTEEKAKTENRSKTTAEDARWFANHFREKVYSKNDLSKSLQAVLLYRC